MITVSVPRQWYGEFHEFFGRWLANKMQGDVVQTPEVPNEQNWLNWEQGDDVRRLDDARQFYQLISPKARLLIDYWIEHPRVINNSRELADAIGADEARSIPGILASMGARRKPLYRTLPFEFRDGPAGGTYWMNPEVASLFESARSSLQGR